MLEVAGSNPTPASFSCQLLLNFFSIFFLNFSCNYGCIWKLLALFSFFISKYCKKHNVTYVISTTCHSEASEITQGEFFKFCAPKIFSSWCKAAPKLARSARQNRQDCVECFVNLRQNRSKMTKNSIHIYIYCLIFSCNTVIKLLNAAPKSCAKFCLR